MNLIGRMALAAVLLAGSANAATAQEVRAERVERVEFARGASSATVRGRIEGYRMVDYLVNARAGQRMTVRLDTRGRFTYFVVRAPGSEDNLYDSTSGATARLTLPASGDYRIRVFQMRNAARRGERSNYSLTVSVGR
jgi:nitrous oxidase accessory protein NosD